MSIVKSQIFHTSSSSDWSLWDKFISETPRGIYLQSSSWLGSYSAYGFEASLLLSKDSEGAILGGMGVVLAKTGPLKVLICPYGPILKEGSEILLTDFVESFKRLGEKSGAFLSQLSLPFAGELSRDPKLAPFFLPQELVGDSFSESGSGIEFKYVTGISAIRAIQLLPEEPDPYTKVLANYKSSCRRNVKKSDTFGHEIVFAKGEKEIEEAYAVIESNADNQGYAVRSWGDFGDTLTSMVDRGQAIIAKCVNHGEIKGALIVFNVGQKLHYIMGGTVREKEDQKVGHFLHDQMIRLGIEKGYQFYDISMGGSDGVVRFKEGFGGVVIPQEDTRHWIHKPAQFWAYKKLLPWVQQNKKLVSRFLSKS